MDHDDDWILFRLQRLDPGRFEEFCCALLTAEGHDVRHVGAAGADGGIDISTKARDGERWVIQCKRYKSIGPSQAGPEITKVIENPPNLRPTHYRLVATCSVSRAVDEELEARAAKADFPLHVDPSWDATKLVAFLRDSYPNLREEFISPLGALPFWNVPRRNDYFTGREELLDELGERLESEGSTALTQTITGLGGIGKTQIAIEYCHRQRSAFDGGVFWLDASSRESLLAGYAELAVDLGKVGREVLAEDAARAFLQQLAQTNRWLVVLDNADEPVAIRPLLPPTTGGQVLITTRALKPALGRAKPLPVDTLPIENATDFLLDRADRHESERTAASELAKALGGLPLALEQAAAFLAQHDLNFGNYLDVFQRERLQLFDQQGPVEGHYDRTVATTWNISFQKLQLASRAAAEALEACAFLAPEGIPLDLFTGTGHTMGPALGALPTGKDEDLQATIHMQLIGPITQYSLAKYDPAEGGSFSIHRLVQEVIRLRILSTEEESSFSRLIPKWLRRRRKNRTVEICEAINKALILCFPIEPTDPRCWAEASRWLPHIQALRSYWPIESVEDPTVLWMRAGNYTHSAGKFSESLLLYEAAMVSRAKTFGLGDSSTLAPMNNVANARRELGDFQHALRKQTVVLESVRNFLGEEHPDTLVATNTLALILNDLGRIDEAKELMTESLRISVRKLGKSHPSTIKYMNNLAGLLRSLGKHHEAIRYHKGAVRLNKRVVGLRHPDTLLYMDNYATTLLENGEALKAKELHVDALELRRELLGEEHPDTLISINNLASTLLALGEFHDARTLSENALGDFEGLGKEHPRFLKFTSNYAEILMAMGEFSKARELNERVLNSRREVLGEEHPDTIVSLNNLASSLHAQGMTREARILLEKAMQTSQEVLGEAHPSTLNTMNNLASTLWELGDASEARELFENLLKLRQWVLGEEHPDTLNSMNNLAGILGSLGEVYKEQRLLEKSLNLRQRILGEDHPDTLISIHNLCASQARTDEMVDADLLKQLLEGVAKLPAGTPIRKAAEARWLPSDEDSD